MILSGTFSSAFSPVGPISSLDYSSLSYSWIQRLPTTWEDVALLHSKNIYEPSIIDRALF